MVSLLRASVFTTLYVVLAFAYNEMTLHLEELTGSVTVSDVANWVCVSTKTVGVGTTTCQHFALPSYGPFGGTTQTGRTITSIPPHNRVVFNLNLLMGYYSTAFDSTTENVKVYIDGTVASTWTFNAFAGQTTVNEFCSWANITQVVDTVNVNVIPTFTTTFADHYLYIRDFRLWYTPCHKSCSVCSTTDQNTCSTCPNFSTLSGSTCVCNTGYYLYSNTCVTTCPTGYTTDTVAAECLLNVLNCATSATVSTCSVCSAGYYLNVLDSLCYASCPQGLETVGTNCQPYYYVLNPTLAYEVLGAFDRAWVSNSELSLKGISITQCTDATLCDQPKSRIFSWCGSQKIFGGFGRIGQTVLYKTITGLSAHYRFRFYVDLYLIDDWSAGVSIVITFSTGTSYTITASDCTSSSYRCGTPGVPDCKYTFDKIELHTATSLKFTITTAVAYNTAAQAFGLNNLHVEIENCTAFTTFVRYDLFALLGSTNCKVCDATGCLTCSSTTYLHTVDGLCYTVCPTGYYGDSTTKTCLACALQCETCLTSSTNCVTCAGNRTQAPTCDCPSGTVSIGGTDVTCTSCFFRCATCSGSTSNCTTCAAKRDSTTIPTCSCVSGTYEIYGTPACQDCFNVCSSCTGSNQADCTACKSTTRDPANSCNCYTHYYGPITNQDCSICNITCQNCTAGTSSDCTSCPSGSAPSGYVARVLTGTQCVCPVGSYDSGEAYCPVCNYRCAQCTGPTYSSTDCQVCQTGRDITNNCACITGFDIVGVATCAACPVECGTCTSAGVCLTCSSTHRTTIPTCACTTGYYENYTAACGTCSSICLTCTNSTSCTSCATGRDPPSCDCKYGTYEDSSGTCQDCHQNCASCYGGTSVQCIQCAPNRTGPPTCTCPDGYFQVSGQVRCPKCDSSCLTCNASGASACTSCDTSIRILSGTKCVCKANLYANIYGDCVSCGSHCATCSSTGTCSKCAGNRTGTACDCPTGTYDSGADTCPACSSQCSECSGSASNCTVCSTNRSTTPTCSCSSNAYLPTANPTSCLLCSVKCTTCTGTQDTCLTCTGNRLFVSSSSDCICPSYTYEDSVSTNCPSCYRSCKTCKGGTSADCVTCRDTYTMNTSGKCVCLSGYYEDTTNVQCRQCDTSCSTCTTAGSSGCSSCATGYQLVNGACILSGSSSCSVLCSACNTSYKCTGCLDSTRELVNGSCLCLGGMYDSNNTCYECDSSCKQCSGPSASECTYCRSGYTLVGGMCQTEVTQQDSSNVMMIILIIFGSLFFLVMLYVAYRSIQGYAAKKKTQGYKKASEDEDAVNQNENGNNQTRLRQLQNQMI